MVEIVQRKHYFGGRTYSELSEFVVYKCKSKIRSSRPAKSFPRIKAQMNQNTTTSNSPINVVFVMAKRKNKDSIGNATLTVVVTTQAMDTGKLK